MSNKKPDPLVVAAKYLLIIPGLAAERWALTQLEKFDTLTEKADNAAEVIIDRIKYPK